MANEKLYVDCPPGYWMYKCAAIGIETCCSVDACQLGGCPVNARPSSTPGQQWGAIVESTSTAIPDPDPTGTVDAGEFSAPSLQEIEARTTETKWVTVPSTTYTAWVTATDWIEPAATDDVAGAAPIPPPESPSPTALAFSSGASSLHPGAVAGISVGLAVGLVFFAVLACFMYCGRSDGEQHTKAASERFQDGKTPDVLQETSDRENIWPQMSPRPKSLRDVRENRKPKSVLRKTPKIMVERSALESRSRPPASVALAERPNTLCLSPGNIVEQSRMFRTHSIYNSPAVSPVSAHSATSSDEISQLDSSPLNPEFELDSIPAARPGYAELESPTMPFFKLSPPPPPRRPDMSPHSIRRSYAASTNSCYSSPALSPALEISLLEQPRATLSPTAAERAWKIPVNSWATYMG